MFCAFPVPSFYKMRISKWLDRIPHLASPVLITSRQRPSRLRDLADDGLCCCDHRSDELYSVCTAGHTWNLFSFKKIARLPETGNSYQFYLLEQK